MDLTRAVMYRGYELNTLRYDEATHDLVGCEITTVEYGQVVGVGYDEKRALDEGRDASDVFLDARRINLAGNVYGRTRQEAFDQWASLSERLSPSAAYRADPSNRGFHPLSFWRPTDSDDFNTTPHPHLINQMLMARPMATPGARFNTDDSGGTDGDALAIPWTAQMLAKDPRITNMEGTSTPVSANAAVGNKPTGGGTIRNYGNTPAVVDIYLVIPPKINGTSAGRFQLNIAGCWNIWLNLPYSENQAVLRYSTDQKVVAYNGALRMGYLTVKGGKAHKHLGPGEHSYNWSVSRTGSKHLLAGSYFLFRDTWV